MRFSLASALLISLALVAGCSKGAEKAESPAQGATETETASKPAEKPVKSSQSVAEKLDAVLAGEHRKDQAERDQYRNPKETLMFFGVSPDMTVVEIFPGGGWYTNVLAPWIATGSGTYVAVNADPGEDERRIARQTAFEDRFADTALYGNIQFGTVGGDAPMVADGTADVVLTFRNVHSWMGRGTEKEYYDAFFAALKPGGVLGVVEHRGDPNVEQDPRARTGYVREDVVIAQAQAAGFEFDGKSEINANAKDDRDHPFGVWTLKPRRRSPRDGETVEGFDRDALDAIGESDRMTLKFRKPANDEGRLLE